MNSTIVGIVSDTHEHIRILTKAIKVFRDRSPFCVIHCGDIVSPPILERFSGLNLKVVFGNNDGERSGLKKKCAELGFDEIQDSAIFSIAEKQFFVNHGTNPAVIDAAAAAQKYDYVLHGHTHTPRDEVIGRTKVINPGALYAARQFTIAFLEVETGQVEFVEIPD